MLGAPWVRGREDLEMSADGRKGAEGAVTGRPRGSGRTGNAEFVPYLYLASNNGGDTPGISAHPEMGEEARRPHIGDTD